MVIAALFMTEKKKCKETEYSQIKDKLTKGFSALSDPCDSAVSPLWMPAASLPVVTRNSSRFLKKLEIELPYYPAIPLRSKHIEETRIDRDTCIPMFMAAVFIK